MKFLAGMLASLLVPLVLAASVSFVVSRTIMRPGYLHAQAQQSGFYPEAAKVLQQATVHGLQGDGMKLEPHMEQTIATIFSAGYIEKKVGTFLSEFYARYQNDGPVPIIDLRDLVEQARAAGMPAVDGSADDLYLEIPAETDVQLQQFFNGYSTWSALDAWVSLALFLLLVLISVYIRSYGALVFLFGMSAFLQVLLVLVFRIAPGAILNNMPVESQWQQIADAVTKLATRVTADMALQFILLAGAFGVAFILALGVMIISKIRHRISTPGQKSVSPTPTVQPSGAP